MWDNNHERKAQRITKPPALGIIQTRPTAAALAAGLPVTEEKWTLVCVDFGMSLAGEHACDIDDLIWNMCSVPLGQLAGSGKGQRHLLLQVEFHRQKGQQLLPCALGSPWRNIPGLGIVEWKEEPSSPIVCFIGYGDRYGLSLSLCYFIRWVGRDKRQKQGWQWGFIREKIKCHLSSERGGIQEWSWEDYCKGRCKGPNHSPMSYQGLLFSRSVGTWLFVTP